MNWKSEEHLFWRALQAAASVSLIILTVLFDSFAWNVLLVIDVLSISVKQ